MLAALEGLRVLEIGSNLTAHYVGRQLAQLGAEVLKVEPGGGDPSRRRGPFVRDIPHHEGSALFLYLNLGKRGITLDPSTPTGEEILLKLAARSDIVLWGDAVAEGQAAASSVERGRTAVWILVSPYGATGPHSSWLAHNLNIFHAGGEGYLLPGGIGWLAYSDREPIKGPGYLGEFSAGDSMVAAAVIGLMAADPGEGPLVVDASVQEALLQLVRAENSQFRQEGTVASRAMRSLGIAGQMPAKDGWVELMPLAPGMMDRLFDWMGRPSWTQEFPTESLTVEARRALGDRLTQRLGDWTAQLSREELFRGGQERGIAVGPVLAPTEILVDPQMEARGFFVEVDHPYAGPLKYPLVSYIFTPQNEQPAPRAKLQSLPAPLLGQHNVDVLEGELGFSREEVIALYETGII